VEKERIFELMEMRGAPVGARAVSVVALVIWLVVAHGLWERPSGRADPKRVQIANAVTVLTGSTPTNPRTPRASSAPDKGICSDFAGTLGVRHQSSELQ